MVNACPLSVVRPSSSITSPRISAPDAKSLLGFNRRFNRIVIPCRASSSSGSSVTEFDLYDLLGIHSSSDHSQIKTAYRSLQKRCHPDIAGAEGHDMAIILNEAYAVLSDPSSRLAYDKVGIVDERFMCFVI